MTAQRHHRSGWPNHIGLSILLLFLAFLEPAVARNHKRATNLENIRATHRLPGLAAFTVSSNGSLVSDAVGVRKQGNTTALTKDDKFHLGSNTKAMTATLLAIMIKNGNLTWTSTLSQVLPQLTNISSTHRDTTLAMLAAHRSGIIGDVANKDPALYLQLFDPQVDPVVGRRSVAQLFLELPPDSTPNTTYNYSNTNYIILGHIVDQQGSSWEETINSTLWTPLSMTECGFGITPQSSPEAIDNPWPHYKSSNGDPVPHPLNATADNPRSYGPAGTVHCGISSYSKFLAFHLNGLAGRNTTLLDPSEFEILHTPYPGGGENYTAGAWGVGNSSVFGGEFLAHTGTNTLNFAYALLSPIKDRAYAALTNIYGEEAAVDTISALFDGDLVLSIGGGGTAPGTPSQSSNAMWKMDLEQIKLFLLFVCSSMLLVAY